MTRWQKAVSFQITTSVERAKKCWNGVSVSEGSAKIKPKATIAGDNSKVAFGIYRFTRFIGHFSVFFKYILGVYSKLIFYTKKCTIFVKYTYEQG